MAEEETWINGLFGNDGIDVIEYDLTVDTFDEKDGYQSVEEAIMALKSEELDVTLGQLGISILDEAPISVNKEYEILDALGKFDDIGLASVIVPDDLDVIELLQELVHPNDHILADDLVNFISPDSSKEYLLEIIKQVVRENDG